jgi:hypothetical protein
LCKLKRNATPEKFDLDEKGRISIYIILKLTFFKFILSKNMQFQQMSSGNQCVTKETKNVKSLHKNGWMDIRWTINNHKSSDT